MLGQLGGMCFWRKEVNGKREMNKQLGNTQKISLLGLWRNKTSGVLMRISLIF